MIDRLALFGATGDLAGRYLLPALAALQAAGELPDGFRLTAAAIEDWDDDAFRRHADERLREHAPAVAEDARHALVRSSRYRRIDFADAAGVAAVIGGADARPLVTYLALPPAVFPAAVTAIGKADLPAGSRIALEKPFGEDLASAVALNRLLAKVVADAGEQAVFRVDHFLGLATVQNLLGLRLANRVFDAAWNSLHIERVEIVWDETLTLEGRGYYDASGALRDLIQNHLLHVFCLVALESPPTLNERELRDRKLDILRSVRPPTAAEMSRRTRRGPPA
ncbi:MAG TPA: glucose-6-phosphate dehydrogenase, partial [Candidatus Limnocylindria bacterium]|nr:glucose-6-phosphate dehydrogenase [Candidatus Limnocylindria bacterium]